MVSAIFSNFAPFIGRILIFLIFIYVIFCLVTPWIAAPLLFPKTPANYTEIDSDIQMLELEDGTQIATLHAFLPNASKCILFSHGNAQDLDNCRAITQRFNELGYSALAYDYPGYGLSNGKSSEKSFYDSAKAVYKYLLNEKGFKENHIILYGFSIGSGPTVELALHSNAAAAVVEGGFTSPYRIYTRYGVLPREPFNNISKISRIKTPLLILHGTKDKTVSYAHGKQLFEQANEPKKMVSFPDGAHGNLFSDFAPLYNEQFSKFIESL